MSLEEKKAKGLCFRCNEKYHYGHKCSDKGLHSLEAETEEEGEGFDEIAGVIVGEVIEEQHEDELVN